MKIIIHQSLLFVNNFLRRHSKNRITWSGNVMILSFFLNKIAKKIVKINNAIAHHVGISFKQLSSTKDIPILKIC